MKCKIFGLLVLFFVFLPILAVQAQVQPTQSLIPFTGSFPGQPDGPVDLRLRLFPVASGGTQCFEETQTVTVSTETFFAFIGDATTGGIPPSPCFTTNTSLWIAFAMDGSPDTEIGARAAITSSGYAHFALGVTDNAVTTAKIQDMAVTGAKIEDSAITSAKIATSSVDSSKIVDNSIGASQVDSTQVQRRVIGSCDVGNAIRVINDAGTVTCQPTGGGGGIGGSGTADQVPKFTGATTVGDSAISEVGGNVGIGVPNPNEQLEITGNLRLPPSTATVGVIKSGADRFIHNFGLNNFFAGVNAGNLTLSGFGNNTGVGFNALQSLANGAANTAVGVSALRSNTGGFSNTAVGGNALFSNTMGLSNTAVGRGALFINTASDNTAVGTDALGSNTTGSNNTAIGSGANVSAGNLTNATAIGANAIVSQSNSLVLGNNANVGIGTTSPAAKLEVVAAGTSVHAVSGFSTGIGSSGVRGQSTNSVGVMGLSINHIGVLGEASRSTEPGVLAKSAGGSDLNLGLRVLGKFEATGTKTAVVPLQDGQHASLYAEESTEVWFSDYGSVQLVSGLAVVQIDREFLQTVNTTKDYHVFLTARGNPIGSVYIDNETPSSFEIRESSGTANIKVSYRIVAKRKDFAEERMKRVASPYVYSQPETKVSARDPEGMKRMVEEKEQLKSSDARTAALP